MVRRVVESARHQARSAAGGGGVGAECEGAAGKSGNIARYGGRVARLSYEQVALAKLHLAALSDAVIWICWMTVSSLPARNSNQGFSMTTPPDADKI